MTSPSDPLPSWPEVAARAMGGRVLAASDELFAEADNLINDWAAGHDTATFGPRGKVYDGWETRRRRDDRGVGAADWAVIRLGVPAVIHHLVIDTAFFTGNSPTHASVEALTLLGYPSTDDVLQAHWTPVLTRSPLLPGAANAFAVGDGQHLATHVKLTIHPDGGVARLRVHGEVVADPRWLGGRIDLAAASNGGLITGCSNRFYSSPGHVIAPGRSQVMSDGWETARRRDDGNDWLTLRLAAPGAVHDVVVDTSRFVGNAPGEVRVSDVTTGLDLLPRTRVQPDTEHRFRVVDVGTVTELRLDVYPDGGLSRLRVNGEVAPQSRSSVAARWRGLLPPDVAEQVDPSTFFG